MDAFSARLRFWRDHRWAPGRMSDYLDAELPAGPHRRMEAHLAGCAECRRLFAGLTVVVNALHRLTGPASGADAAQLAVAVRGRVRGSQPPPG